MKVSVVIPTHNRSDALAKTLAQLAQQQFDQPWEVIVVNNRCTDNTDAVVQRQVFPVPLRLVHEEIPGAAAARNAGAAVARGDFIIFLDNDILVGADFVQRHYDALMVHSDCWILGQVVSLPEQERTPFGQFRQALCPYVPPDQGMTEARDLTGAIFSLPRADLARLGGFDEMFDVASGEDLELAMRAWRAGITILFDPSIVGVHNDWAGFSIRDYCRRQRLYSRTEPLFWHKYGEAHPRQKLVRENRPPLGWRQDGLGLLCRKTVKRFVGTRVMQSIFFGVCGVLEHTCPWPPVLWRLYRLALAGAIYKGFQEGFMMHSIKLGHMP